jgi:hypothetical protein
MKKRWFRCQCDCGNIKEIYTSSILKTTFPTRSCGCLNLDNLKSEKGHSGLIKVFNSYRGSARRRNLEFNLTPESFQEMATKPCHYCGAESYSMGKGNYRKDSPQESIDHSRFIYTGIDRIDSDKGYVEGNIVPCCKKCNLGKHIMTDEEFKSWITKVFKFYVENK